jgi:hypothetical protein
VESGFAIVSAPFKELQWLPENYHWDIADEEGANMIREGLPIHYLLTDDRPQQNVWTCYFDCDIQGSTIFDNTLWALRTHTYITLSEPDNTPLSVKFGAVILELAEDQSYHGEFQCYKRVGMACTVIGGDAYTSRQRLASRRFSYGQRPWETYSAPWDYKTVALV